MRPDQQRGQESDAELLRAIRRTVVQLLEASAVLPEEICAPATARIAIMIAPPRVGLPQTLAKLE